MNCRLNGISFAELPHISNKSRDEAGQLVKGEEITIIRETGEAWDSDARPAYSVRLGCMHIGYIPLVETIKEEALRARGGYRKIWKSEFEALSKEELRKVAIELNKNGKILHMHDWEFIGTDKTREIARNKMRESETVEIVRDYLFTEIMRNNLVPIGRVSAVYFDKDSGRNYEEIGDICSITVRLDIW